MFREFIQYLRTDFTVPENKNEKIAKNIVKRVSRGNVNLKLGRYLTEENYQLRKKEIYANAERFRPEKKDKAII